MEKKFDFKKEYKVLYKASDKKIQVMEVPSFKYLKIEGKGNPATSLEFQEKVQNLYGLAYTIKFILKKAEKDPFDYAVAPLSGLWYADDMSVFVDEERNEWVWTMMIKQPDRITKEIVQVAKSKLVKKKKELKYLDSIYMEIYQEGLCAQILHRGPYSEEAPTIKKLHDYIFDNDYTFDGKHHEIYLGDPQKTKPENLKTIIRQPVKKQ